MDSFFQDKTIVVTGAAGFVPSHLCDRLLAEGAKVIGVDNFITGQQQNLSTAHKSGAFMFIEADVSQPATTYLPEGITPDIICHLASPASPPRYQAHPVETYLVNSIGTHYLLSYIKERAPQATFLFASTSEVYGDPAIHPQPESYWGNVNPNGVRSCYDESKRLGETIAGVFSRDFGIDVRIMRIFNTYGPRMDLADGRIIPNFIQQLLHQQPLTIYGDGFQTRSYCFVDDLVEGMLAFLKTEQATGQTINLGNPEELTISQTAEVVKTVAAELRSQGVSLPEPTEPAVEFKPLPKDDPTRRKPDITLAQELLQWQPTTSFTEGLALTIRSFIS